MKHKFSSKLGGCLKSIERNYLYHFRKWAPLGMVANMLNCKIYESQFESWSCYIVHFWTYTLRKSKNSLIRQAIDYIVSLKLFDWNGFSNE